MSSPFCHMMLIRSFHMPKPALHSLVHSAFQFPIHSQLFFPPHYSSLCPCVSLRTSLFLLLSMCVTVYLFIPPSVHVCHSAPLYSSLCPCVSLRTFLFLHLSMCVTALLFIPHSVHLCHSNHTFQLLYYVFYNIEYVQ